MNELKVADQYRTNALSIKPGGYEVKVRYSNGQVFVYDKVKKPGSYIKSISEKNSENGSIQEIFINDSSVWVSGCGREYWEI
jgi:hypothetical protein